MSETEIENGTRTEKQSGPSGAGHDNRQSRGAGKKAGRGRSGPRKLAEWVSLGISAALIATLAGYLVYQGLQPQPPYVAAEAQVLMNRVLEKDGKYILPIEVVNHGRLTLRELNVEVEYRGPDGKQETREFTIDYLGEQSKQKIYLYFDQHPRDLQVKAEPLTYRLD